MKLSNKQKKEIYKLENCEPLDELKELLQKSCVGAMGKFKATEKEIEEYMLYTAKGIGEWNFNNRLMAAKRWTEAPIVIDKGYSKIFIERLQEQIKKVKQYVDS